MTHNLSGQRELGRGKGHWVLPWPCVSRRLPCVLSTSILCAWPWASCRTHRLITAFLRHGHSASQLNTQVNDQYYANKLAQSKDLCLADDRFLLLHLGLQPLFFGVESSLLRIVLVVGFQSLALRCGFLEYHLQKS